LPTYAVVPSPTLFRSGGSVWTSEYRFRRRDGTHATVVDRGYVLHDSAGHPVRVIGSAMDVTKRRKTEAIQSAIYRISEAANNARSEEHTSELQSPDHL